MPHLALYQGSGAELIMGSLAHLPKRLWRRDEARDRRKRTLWANTSARVEAAI
jgi:hypothetical protein